MGWIQITYLPLQQPGSNILRVLRLHSDDSLSAIKSDIKDNRRGQISPLRRSFISSNFSKQITINNIVRVLSSVLLSDHLIYWQMTSLLHILLWKYTIYWMSCDSVSGSHEWTIIINNTSMYKVGIAARARKLLLLFFLFHGMKLISEIMLQLEIENKKKFTPNESVRASLKAEVNVLVFCSCNRGASGHVTRDYFPFNQTLIGSPLIKILLLTQQCGLESNSSQYLGRLSRWQEQIWECDIGKIIAWRGNNNNVS